MNAVTMATSVLPQQLVPIISLCWHSVHHLNSYNVPMQLYRAEQTGDDVTEHLLYDSVLYVSVRLQVIVSDVRRQKQTKYMPTG